MTTVENRQQSIAPTWPVFATLGIGLSLVLTAVATFWDITGNDGGADTHEGRAYLVTVGIIVVVAAAAFTAAVRLPSARTGLTMSIVAVLSNVVFWAGVPCVLAAAAAYCALTAGRPGGRLGGLAKTTLALSLLAAVLNVVAAIFG
jgi:hypothetical protein